MVRVVAWRGATYFGNTDDLRDLEATPRDDAEPIGERHPRSLRLRIDERRTVQHDEDAMILEVRSRAGSMRVPSKAKKRRLYGLTQRWRCRNIGPLPIS